MRVWQKRVNQRHLVIAAQSAVRIATLLFIRSAVRIARAKIVGRGLESQGFGLGHATQGLGFVLGLEQEVQELL